MEECFRDLAPCALCSSLWILLAVSFPTSIYAIRNSFKEGYWYYGESCFQGRYLLSDDNGYACTALSVDSWTRCCPAKGDQFSCRGCSLVSQCCNSYVSCCLDPSRTKKDLALRVKIAGPISARTYSSVFEFCVGRRCRHNSASVVMLSRQPFFFFIISTNFIGDYGIL
ncbi:uncharacterized protein LOC122019365 [Zingiber officinale]|uniref:uncharacterized protein LOC122019365 n=1 Tax=Zingiber officinale TaxID=94328 RepID=UPI001C4A831F|nr:uncharacterized protein LOC122019365 [Zingiber officinale]